MYQNKKVAVIIAAAGKGTRIGGPIPKQFLKIGGEPVLLKTLKAFSSLDEVDYIFIVANEEYVDYCQALVAENGIGKVEGVVKGGGHRQDSVYNALQEVNRKRPGVAHVLIHDGARPFVSEEIILNVIKATAEEGAAVACVAMKNSVRKAQDGVSQSVDRRDYFSVQTPQGFKKAILIEAYDKALQDGYYGTDDAGLVERVGYRVKMVSGDYQNIKITTKEDLPMENRVGTGFDVHRLVSERKLVLGGVEIFFEKGLEGHSDADVLVHALMDALLGAAALGDIGRHFPDSNHAYKGISSMVLLERVGELLSENFFSIGNVDVTVIAQRPKISPYIDGMRENISQALGLEKSRINIKGTTTEKLGFTGREEGIAAEAVCSIYR
ncbi:MAG: 2-C-methyl-D-erythritol 2,4-cyclodiphosphate synthase [Clostridiales bacterium]|nr:2-C-methyl-D-erythritol 2,4-cyclodiphosphate synthase [Clostridiales bacterium]